jgi:alpha/beta superfamily hydrolase
MKRASVFVALVVSLLAPPAPVAAADRLPSLGTPVAVRPLPADLRLAGTGRAWRVWYVSTSWNGRRTVVSGTVSVPAGRPPAGGWRLVGFGPGFNGTPDACAASRAGTPPFVRPLGEALLAAGYAVAVTDYEGIGTPGEGSGVHGRAEAAALVDAVRAARRIAPVSSSWAAVGYSMGGHAALWAGSLASSYAPELRHLGTVAVAPTTQWGLQSAASGVPGAPLHPAVPYLGRTLPLTDRGAFRAEDLFTPLGLDLVAAAGRLCVADLAAAATGVTNADAFLDPPAAGAAFAALLADDEVPVARYPRPVRLAHGTADALPAALTELTAGQLAAAGTDVAYLPVEGADHFTVLGSVAPQVLDWLDEMFSS